MKMTVRKKKNTDNMLGYSRNNCDNYGGGCDARLQQQYRQKPVRV